MKSYALVALLVGSTVSAAQGAVLVSDNFTNSSGTAVTTVSDTQAVGTGQYIRTFDGSSTMNVTTAAPLASGNVLSFGNGTSSFYRAFNGGATTTLNGLAVGETLAMSFDISFSAAPGSENFSFGFVNNASPNSIVYPTLDLNGGTSEFRYRAGSTFQSDNGAAIAGTAFTSPTLASATKYQFSLQVTKTSEAGELTLAFLQDGMSQGSFAIAPNNTFVTTEGGATITGIAFRHSQTPGMTTFIDNVVVETIAAVPEPTSLVSLASLGLLALRRRK